MFLARFAVISAVAFYSAFAFGQNSLDLADEAFGERANNRQQIQKALSLYNKAVSESTNLDDKIYAVEQIGRLSNYEASIIPKNSTTKAYKVKLFDSCMKNADKISSKSIGEKIPAHYYVRGMCLAQWARARGIATSLGYTKELIRTLEEGRKIDPTYEGGGFARTLAAIYLNLPPINVFGPTRDAKKSLNFANGAIKSSAYEGAINPEFETGNYFFNAYIYQAEALIKLRQKAKAKSVLKQAISRIEKEDINQDRNPETMVDLKNLKELLKDL